MKFLKKIGSFLLAMICALTFAACQQNTGTVTGTATPSASLEATAEIMTEGATSPTATPQLTQDATQEGTLEAIQDVTPDATQEVTQDATQAATKEATPKPTTTINPTATPTKTPTATAKPTATSTANPGNPYSPVSKLIIANDPVAPAVNLDSRVPQNLKEAYNTVKNGFSKDKVSGSGEKTVNFSTPISVETLLDVIYYVEAYNPQLFYVTWNNISYSTFGSTGKVISVTLNCTSAVSQYTAVENKVNELVAEANKKPNLFERELYIHDWLVKNISYTTETENCANIYGALIEGKALCEGYSRAFQYLMNKIGIETVLITGNAEGAHMWNMVTLYGDCYFVDVTHDDPLPDEAIPDGKEYLIEHSCFNVPTKILEKTHTIDAKGSRSENNFLQNTELQTCTQTTYNYYYVKGLAVSNLEQFKYVLYENKSLQNVEVFFTGTMPGIEDIKKEVEAFIKATYPGKGYSYYWPGADSFSYKRNCIRISWTIK